MIPRALHPYVFALLALLVSGACRAQLLDVNLEGLEGELLDNALAWLGDPPETAQA